ncbi:MAG: MobF family relaxase [Acidimicrobiales bacterium]
MLLVTALSDRAGGYYLADLAGELGPLGVAGPPEVAGGCRTGEQGHGCWVGAGAEGLGLRGPVGGRDLGTVLSGAAPATGRRLAGRAAAVSAFDLTFSAPKSVSVLVALGAPEVAAAVLGSHEAAVRGALDYVAHHGAAVRRTHESERQVLATRGIVGAAFTHGTSRALDPHLHTHVVVANLAQGPDGRWSALDGRGLFAHARAAGALYDAHLRWALTEALGVDWTPRGAGHEVDGVDPFVLGGFSHRTAEIRAHLAERSLGPGRAGRVAWAATRDEKVLARAPGEIAAVWADRAAALGLRQGALDAVCGRRSGHDPSIDERHFGATLLAGGPAGVTRRETVGAWAASLRRGTTAESVGRCVDQLVPGGPTGVAEPVVAPARVVAPPGVLGVLGPRPAAPGALAVWLGAARSLDRYRGRWGEFASTPDAERASRAGLARASAAQVAEHLAVARQVREVRRALGREPVRAEREALGLGRR